MKAALLVLMVAGVICALIVALFAYRIARAAEDMARRAMSVGGRGCEFPDDGQ